MGAKFAPSYAIIFMGWWELSHIFADNNLYRPMIRLYRRYIDDLLFVWQGDEQSAYDFVNWLNTNEVGLWFTHEYHRDTINFLYLSLRGLPSGRIEKGMYRKPIAWNTLLNAKSCHPNHVPYAVAKGQFIRTKRNCTDTQKYKQEANNLSSRLLERGYKRSVVNKARSEVDKLDRKVLLQENCSKNNKTFEGVTFITNYSAQYNTICEIICKHFKVLIADDLLVPTVEKGIRCAYRKAKTLGNMVAPSEVIKLIQAKHTWLQHKDLAILTSLEGSSTDADLPLQDVDIDVKTCVMEEEVAPLESDANIMERSKRFSGATGRFDEEENLSGKKRRTAVASAGDTVVVCDPSISSTLTSISVSIPSPAVSSAAGAFPVAADFLPIYSIPVTSSSPGPIFSAPVSLPSLVTSAYVSFPYLPLTLKPLDFPTRFSFPTGAGLSLSAPSFFPPQSLGASFASDPGRKPADDLLLQSQRSPVRSPSPAVIFWPHGMEGGPGAPFMEPHGLRRLPSPVPGPARAWLSSAHLCPGRHFGSGGIEQSACGCGG
ncbi:uncharacterized protein LOC128664438 [Bombina bombina]|uniref:uncharacterized protein LOC128664438 n=1 Tax=Bombina bombina TaxID=8345 RepID=UPI00235AE8A4|nr:uncharacterized protein LOC128664438 [Bombina bombina]